MIPRKCNYCQVEYMAEKRYLNRGQGIYCSKECSGMARRDKPRITHEPNVECSWCRVRFYKSPGHQKVSKSGLFFCCKEHQSLAFADTNHPVNSGPRPSGKARPVCPECNKPFRGNLGMCRSCYYNFIIEEWLSGNNEITLNKGRTRDTKTFVKRYLVETRGDKCEKCKFDSVAPDGRSIIQMNHIDGNCLNNNIINLELLCPNCHAMTPNYGSLNKISGRSWRRKDKAPHRRTARRSTGLESVTSL